MGREEVLVREVHRMDVVFIVVSLVVWCSLAAWSVFIAMSSGIAGAGIAFIVMIVAVVGWIKLVQQWMRERQRLLEGVERGSLDKEIRELR